MSPNQDLALELDVDNPLLQPQQKPSNLLGEVYFNHRLYVYQTLRHKEMIDPRSVIYHVQWDKCFYFSSDNSWKAAPVIDFPEGTKFYWYRSGPLKIPNWPETRNSVLTPQIPDSSPESPPVSAFRPIQLQQTDLVTIPIVHPTPTHRLPRLKTFGNHNEQSNYLPNIFSPEQQLEIDRQISIWLQEIELAKAQQTPLPQRNSLVEHSASPRVEPASVGSTTNKRGDKQTVLNRSRQGDSAPVESPGQHQKTQHVPHHQQTTPVSRKPKKRSTKPKVYSMAD